MTDVLKYRQIPSCCSLIPHKVRGSVLSDILLFPTCALHTCRLTGLFSLAPPPPFPSVYLRVAGDIYRADGSIYRSEELVRRRRRGGRLLL